MRLPFTSRRLKRQLAHDMHPSHNPWNEPEKPDMMPDLDSFTPEDIELAEEMLTELLYIAITCNARLRPAFTTLAEGVAAMISPDAIERSKEYARYRARQDI